MQEPNMMSQWIFAIQRRIPIEAMNSAKSKKDKGRHKNKKKKGSRKKKFCERERSKVVVRSCGKESYIQRFCPNQALGNGRNPFVRPNERNKRVSTHIVGNMGALNSVSIRIERRTYWALEYTGAGASVIGSGIYDSFRPRLELQMKDIKLHTIMDSHYM